MSLIDDRQESVEHLAIGRTDERQAAVKHLAFSRTVYDSVYTDTKPHSLKCAQFIRYRFNKVAPRIYTYFVPFKAQSSSSFALTPPYPEDHKTVVRTSLLWSASRQSAAEQTLVHNPTILPATLTLPGSEHRRVTEGSPMDLRVAAHAPSACVGA